MKTYMTPDVFVTEFQANVAVAACDRLVIGTETTKVYEKQDVYCEIGGQQEVVFNATSGCSTSASQWAIVEDDGTMYFFWYTGDTAGSNNKPDDTVQAWMEGLGYGRGWHYSTVTSSDLITDVLGFSY